jgi:NAD(P)-dependent dehydrogenase (short-subunit alcohol dehydrogenase family)
MMLKDQKAVVIGGGGFLGRAICKAYAREGATLIVGDISHEAAVETLRSATGDDRGLALKVDVSDPASCLELVRTIVSRFGRLDILVNCAALCLVDELTEVTPERWDKVFCVNARGAFFCMQAAAKVMIPQGFGRIINISTPASRGGFPHFASYGASKAAVDSMTRAAAIAWAPHGVTVNCIVPGRMTGGMVDILADDLARLNGKTAENVRVEQTATLPMLRRVGPEEVAEAAVWLASRAASYITADRLNFTGGQELS